MQAAGAYRGYGATQGIFAVECAVSELADRLGIDPVAIREKNMVREGQIMQAYYSEPASACALDRCMARCKELFGWAEKYPVRDMGNGKVRTAGVAMAMQGLSLIHIYRAWGRPPCQSMGGWIIITVTPYERQEMNMQDSKTLLAMCEEQEEKLQFDHFSRADALALGLKLHENAKKQPIPVAVEITVNGLVVFRYFPDGALPDSELWLQRKRNTVELMEMSSLHLSLIHI